MNPTKDSTVGAPPKQADSLSSSAAGTGNSTLASTAVTTPHILVPAMPTLSPTQSARILSGMEGQSRSVAGKTPQPPPMASRFPAIAEDSDLTYILLVGDDTNYNPHFNWSCYLPSAVALDRGFHDRYCSHPLSTVVSDSIDSYLGS